MFRKGILTVICGPSGVGKGTIVNSLLKRNNNIRLSISATTRSPRSGEIDGQNYYFKTIDEFKEMIDKDELIEWVEYCGNYYGTPKKHIEDSQKMGYDIILEIEIEGAANIKNKYPDCVSVFILPPSFEELKQRIEGRGTESPEIIKKRLERANKEILYVTDYDYVLINNDLDEAVQELNCILTSEKLRVNRNKDIVNKIKINRELRNSRKAYL